MLFQLRFNDAIRNGIKTETRRVEKLGEHFRTFPPLPTTVCHVSGKTKWQIGRTYAVQNTRGGFAVMRIKVLDLTYEDLYPITTATALAEGFDTVSDYYQFFSNQLGFDVTDVSNVVKVWAIKFQYIQHSYEIEQISAKIRSIGLAINAIESHT